MNLKPLKFLVLDVVGPVVGIALIFILFILPSLNPVVAISPHGESVSVVDSTKTSIPTVTQTSRPSATPTQTLVPCPPSGVPVKIGEVQIVFNGDVSIGACDTFQKYVRMTVDKFATLGYQTGAMMLYVDTDPQRLTDTEYDIAKKAGCNPDSKQNIFDLWEHGGAQSTKGAAFYLTKGWWQEVQLVERVRVIVGEMSHLLIKNVLGSCQKTWTVPDWYTVGWTEFNADGYASEWGLPPQPDDLFLCKEKLENLTRDKGYCVYMEAQMAFVLLRDSPKYGNGVDKSMEVFVAMAEGKTFNQAFKNVYNVTVSEFSKDFDAFREARYIFTPTVTTTPPPSGDGGE